MGYYVGLDVALRSVALCVIDGDGEIADCLHSFSKPIDRIGFEAGTMSQTLFHDFTAAGYDVVCMEARHVSAALSAMRNKTDRNDARGIAQVVRSGWYRPVHVKSADPTRFTSSRLVGAHFGLTPRRFQSGESDN